MKLLDPGVDPDRFFAHLQGGGRPVLLLDYDGTLAPFRVKRDRALPYPGVRERIRKILDSGASRVVVVSGRAIRDLRPLLGVEPPPELRGSHGWERLSPEGDLERPELPNSAEVGLGRVRDALERLCREGRLEKERVEEKPVSVALHVRGLEADRAREVLEAARSAWKPLISDSELEVHEFDGGLELRVPGRDKGTAVREILADEAGDAPVAYLGDDLTDEDAFRELGSRGLTVLVRTELRETAARVWIRPPDELLAFLDRWHANT